jgi:hypothetical protein
MHLILQYSNGWRADALLLMLAGDKMRVALRGLNETVELQQICGRWLNEDGEPVSIEAILSLETQLESRPLTMTAASA